MREGRNSRGVSSMHQSMCYNDASISHTTFRHATYRHATYRHATYRHATYRHATYRHATYRHATYSLQLHHLYLEVLCHGGLVSHLEDHYYFRSMPLIFETLVDIQPESGLGTNIFNLNTFK